jgi:hypothetical protein
LARLELATSEVFEFGAGHSTLFWAKRAKHVVSVEHDIGWYRTLHRKISHNVTLIHAPDEASYTTAILRSDRKYDVIVIDGLWREGCIGPALSCMTPSGLLVIDNSDWYPHICLELRQSNMLEFSFAGISPVNRITSVTSVFVRGAGSNPIAMRAPTSQFGAPMQKSGNLTVTCDKAVPLT